MIAGGICLHQYYLNVAQDIVIRQTHHERVQSALY